MGLLGVVLALAAAVLWAPAPAQAQSTPLDPVYQSPGIAPPGANDFSCTPAAGHPYPVILVHGTFGDMTISWNQFSPRLVKDGYCVFALDLPRRGTAPLEESADVLSAFIDEVRQRTGAAKVSIVGHSQGGMLPRFVARFRDKAGVIDDLIGLAPSNHGTETEGADLVAPWCPACADQKAGSPFMQTLNAGDEAPPPISYTVIATRYDQVVVPYTSQFLGGTGAVTNITLQDKCPDDGVEHLGIVYDPVALQWALDALGRPGPADPAFVPDCDAPTRGGSDQSVEDQGGAGAPAVRLQRTRWLRERSGRVRIRMRCTGPEGSVCAGRARMSTPGRTFGRARFRIPAGSRKVVRLRLTRAGRRALRGRRSAQVRVRAVVGPREAVRTFHVR